MSDTSILDSLPEIKKIDKSNVLGSVQSLADQVRDAWEQVKSLEVTVDTKKVKNIIVAGMGGSQLGPHVIKCVFKDELHVPLEIYNDYRLPAYTGADSLIVLSSYSGTTEEVLAAAEEAKQSGAQVLVITTGGKLQELATANNWPAYIMNPQHNPSNQPRMAIGYSVFGTIALLIKAGLLKVDEMLVEKVIERIQETSSGLNVDVPQDRNPAKQMAFNMFGRVPVLVGAEHLEGALHVFNNQLNENAKTFSEYRVLPEINHHLLEGLKFPAENDKYLYFVLFQSPLYHERTQRRVEVTQDVIERADIDSTTMLIDSVTKLEQAFEVITFGAYTNFYLAMLEEIDPAPIDTVDYFKEQLKK